MSSYEVLLLFYNCIWSVGKKHFKQLVEEYHLLEHINKDGIHQIRSLDDKQLQINLYQKSAYQDE